MPHFDLALVLHGQYHDWLVAGLLLSLKLAATTLVLALPLAVVVALLRLAPNRLVGALGAVYVEGIRNVPLIPHLLFWYFGAPELLPDALKERLYAGNAEFVCATIALTLYTAAYMAEDIRSGIRAVPTVQFEAGRALGFGYL
jgi:polar amino acid transport system permease protein